MTTWMTSNGGAFTGSVFHADEKKGTAVYSVPWLCGRCGGVGGSDAWKFTGWVCFACGGSGHRGRTKNIKVYTVEAYAKLEAARAKHAAMKTAKDLAKRESARIMAAAALENFRTDNAILITALDAYTGRDSFITDIRAKLHEYGSLSEKQVTATCAALDKAAKASMAIDCPAGRITLHGEVISTKSVESQYGATVKMLVRAIEGFKIWCTVPTGLDAVKGAAVAITVTVEPSADDPKFGFGKRPVLVK